MARMSYRGYNISLRPLRTENLWQLELEKKGGLVIYSYTMNPKKTLGEIEDFAFDEIEKKIQLEINS